MGFKLWRRGLLLIHHHHVQEACTLRNSLMCLTGHQWQHSISYERNQWELWIGHSNRGCMDTGHGSSFNNDTVGVKDVEAVPTYPGLDLLPHDTLWKTKDLLKAFLIASNLLTVFDYLLVPPKEHKFFGLAMYSEILYPTCNGWIWIYCRLHVTRRQTLRTAKNDASTCENVGEIWENWRRAPHEPLLRVRKVLQVRWWVCALYFRNLTCGVPGAHAHAHEGASLALYPNHWECAVINSSLSSQTMRYPYQEPGILLMHWQTTQRQPAVTLYDSVNFLQEAQGIRVGRTVATEKSAHGLEPKWKATLP